MKEVALQLALNAGSIACIVVAAYLAVIGVDGWGWFLFCGLLLAARLSLKDDPPEATP